jgi:hypothetical protein
LQPIFLEVNEDFSFGASTRKYIIRWKIDMSSTAGAGGDDADFHLPEQEYELEVVYISIT